MAKLDFAVRFVAQTKEFVANIRGAQKGVKDGYQDMGDEATKAGQAADKGFQQSNQSANVFSGTLNAIRNNLGKLTAAFAIYKIGGFFKGATQSAASFQEQMSVVQAITGASADELDRLKAAADAAGTTTRYTATEAAQALEQLARAGLSANQSIETLPSVLALAQGNALELGQAAGFIAQAVRGMGMEFSEAGRVADVLAQAAASANTTVEGLGNALSYAAPTANALGMSIEETVAIIAKFADAGIDASRAGTALNSILAQFSDPASQFRQELFDAGIFTNNFRDALAQLAEKGPEGQKAIRAVGREAGPALQALLGQGIGALDDLVGGLENSEGAAQRAAETMDSNLNGALRGLASAWDSLKRNLVTPLLEPITEQVNALSTRIRQFVEAGIVDQLGERLKAGFKLAQDAFNSFMDNFDLDQVIESLKNWLSTTKETVDGWVTALTTAKDTASLVWNTMATGVKTITAVFQVFGAAVTSVMYRVVDGLGYGLQTLGIFSSTVRGIAAETRAVAAELQKASEGMLEGAQKSMDGATESAIAAQEAFARLRGESDETTTSAEKANIALVDLSTTTDDLSGALTGAGAAADEAAAKIDGVTDSAKENEEELAKAEMAALRLEQAYKALGVQSQKELDDAAKKAQDAFRTIADSGKATQNQLKAAFEAYARAAVAANDGVVSSALKSEAAQRGLKIEADETGKVIVQTMSEAAKATREVERAAKDTAGAYREMAQEARTAANEAKNASSGGTGESEKLAGRTTRTSSRAATTGKYTLAELKNIDESLAEMYAQAIADANRGFSPSGGRTAASKAAYERQMAAINQRADAIQRQRAEEQSQQQQPAAQPRTNTLDELSKAMEQALANAIPQAQAASKKTEVTLNLPGGIRTSGMFDDNEAERLVRELQRFAEVSR